ncbi:MAG: hypothetical protein IPK50_16555 [Fibrobacterota bacterium]|nr:hypothetical protein [Fibrobacterota bacterium]QQS03892.1 MAG: hypothetical protein IPK50_16555 [Fibrobacterota bacterium]
MKMAAIKEPMLALIEDAHWCDEILRTSDSQSARRAYARSLFALIEGTIWVFKSVLLGLNNEKAIEINIQELAILSEESFSLNEKGEPKTITKFLPLPSNLLFVAKCIDRYFGIKIDLNTGSNKWRAFKASQSIRNRVMHPKSKLEFMITDEEIATLENTCSWFSDIVIGVLDGLDENIKSYNA